MNFAPAHLKARYVIAEFKAFVQMLIQSGVKRSKLVSPLINISPFSSSGSRWETRCIFCDWKREEFPLSRSSRGLNDTEVSAEEAIFHFGLSSLSSRDWNDPKIQRDRMEKREILKRSNFLPRDLLATQKSEYVEPSNNVEISRGILSISSRSLMKFFSAINRHSRYRAPPSKEGEKPPVCAATKSPSPCTSSFD